MTSRSSAKIAISGHVSDAETLENLIDEALEENVTTDWNLPSLTREELLAHIATAVENQTPLILFVSEAPFGEIPMLEAFCQESNLSFIRFSAPDGEGPSLNAYNHYTDRNYQLECDHGGAVVVPIAEINRIAALAPIFVVGELKAIVKNASMADFDNCPALTVTRDVIATLSSS